MKSPAAFALAGAMALSACTLTSQSISDYCAQRPAVCVLIGAAIVGGVVAIARDNDSSNRVVAAPPPAPSDARLKHSVQYVETLENGVRLHAFKYLNDDRYFVGALAQELLQDERFAHAVILGDDGYYRVDHAALGLRMYNEQAMVKAGQQALASVN